MKEMRTFQQFLLANQKPKYEKYIDTILRLNKNSDKQFKETLVNLAKIVSKPENIFIVSPG